jgi:hypothetical protein
MEYFEPQTLNSCTLRPIAGKLGQTTIVIQDGVRILFGGHMGGDSFYKYLVPNGT